MGGSGVARRHLQTQRRRTPGLHRRRHHQAGGRPLAEPHRRAPALGLRPQTRRRGSLIFPSAPRPTCGRGSAYGVDGGGVEEPRSGWAPGDHRLLRVGIAGDVPGRIHAKVVLEEVRFVPDFLVRCGLGPRARRPGNLNYKQEL